MIALHCNVVLYKYVEKEHESFAYLAVAWDSIQDVCSWRANVEQFVIDMISKCRSIDRHMRLLEVV